MKTIIVDKEPHMVKKLERLCGEMGNIDIVGSFAAALDALDYAEFNRIELAVIDIDIPGMSGVELAKKLRKIRRDLLLVLVSEQAEYVRDCNVIGGDSFVLKPYTREIMRRVLTNMQLLKARLRKDITVRMQGQFRVLKEGIQVPLSGKPKEILELIASRRGTEISNNEIYTTLWPGREVSNAHMKTYFNAIVRLKAFLAQYDIAELLIAMPRGYMLNTEVCEMD